jgi:hypothetical protein
MLGIARNTEVTTAFGLAPLLLRGTRRIALTHERLAWFLAPLSPRNATRRPITLSAAFWPPAGSA